MSLSILKTLEPHLDGVFEKFYVTMLSDKEFSVFFRDEEQVRSLIKRQKKYFLKSLGENAEELRERYTKLGEMHHRLKLPYVDFFAGMGILEEGILLAIAESRNTVGLMESVFKYFRIVRAHTAKGYLNRMLEADAGDIDLYLENVKRSSEVDTTFATERITWLKDLIFAIQSENRAAAPSFKLPNRLMDSMAAGRDEDAALLAYIRETVSRIEIDASNVFYFLENRNYEEVLSLYRELMNIYKLSLMLSNVMTIAASNAVISSLQKDQLTGLLTRNTMNAIIAQELSLADASGYELCLMMMDLDHFKSVNDTYGHAAGDEVLKKSAEIIVENIRATDFAFRIGGEEFLILLKGASGKVAYLQADTIRKALAAHLYDIDGNRFNITASFGLSTFSAPFLKSFEEMLKEVDVKLYDSKRNGRNKVTA